jgi:hypothetical protein
MKDREIIVQKLKEVCNLLEQNLDASNMDVEYMQQRVESMIEEFERVKEFIEEESEGSCVHKTKVIGGLVWHY